MKKKLAVLALLLAAASSAFGQGRTVVSGTVTDATGVPYSNASLTINLTTPTGTVGAYLNGAQIAGSVGPVSLDSNGSFLVQLPDNTLVQCANATGQIVACAPQTQWAFAVTLSPGVPRPVGTGPQTCASTITITGAAQSVSGNFSGCPALTSIGGGGGGGSNTPSTQAGGSCTAAAVLPGTFCMGPSLLPSGLAPTFEIAYANSSSTSTANYSVAGAPLAAPSMALLINANSQNAVTNAPDVTWSLVSDDHAAFGYEIFQKTVSNVTSVSANGTMGSNGSVLTMLGFFGGSITSTPHTATTSTVTCPQPSSQCAGATIGPVSAANMLVLVGTFHGASGTTISNTAVVYDSLGNTWQKIYSTGVVGALAQSMGVWIVQNPVAGSPVITLDGRENALIIGACCKVYEFAGLTGYFAGANGPPGFRFPTASDIQNISGLQALQNFTGTAVIPSDVTIGTTATTIGTVTVQFPQSGCPCRVLISYSAMLDYTAVTNVKFTNLWVSDGTNNMAGVQTAQSNGTSGALTSATYGGVAPFVYSNGQSKTFTWTGIQGPTTAGVIVRAACGLAGCGGGSSFNVSVLTSVQ